jgi:hypothetical protein
MANVRASVAAYENEVRSEQIRAGQAVTLANGPACESHGRTGSGVVGQFESRILGAA